MQSRQTAELESARVVLDGLSMDVPVLKGGVGGQDINDLIAKQRQARERDEAKKRGRTPGTITCTFCGQSAGTLVKVSAQQGGETVTAYGHADCSRDVNAQRMNRIRQQVRTVERAVRSMQKSRSRRKRR